MLLTIANVLCYDPFGNHFANDVWYSDDLSRRELKLSLPKWQILHLIRASNKAKEMIQLAEVYSTCNLRRILEWHWNTAAILHMVKICHGVPVLCQARYKLGNGSETCHPSHG